MLATGVIYTASYDKWSNRFRDGLYLGLFSHTFQNTFFFLSPKDPVTNVEVEISPMTLSWLCGILTFLGTSNPCMAAFQTCAAGQMLLLHVPIRVPIFCFHSWASLCFLNNICQDHAKTRASLATHSPQKASSTDCFSFPAYFPFL